MRAPKSTDFTLRQLRYFLAVAEHENVTQAAEALSISQPAISAAIAQLETALNSQLLVRHHARGVALTPAGRQVFSSAQSLILQADELGAEAKSEFESMSGRLALGCFISVAPIVLPRLMNEFNRKYPAVEFEVFTQDIEQLQDCLLDGRAELALTYDLDLDPEIEKEELWQMKPYVLLGRNHRLAKSKSISLSDLKGEPMVLFDRPHSREYFYAILAQHDIEPIVKHRTDSFELVRSLVANGRGFSILNLKPKTRDCYDGKKVAYVPLRGASSAVSVVITKLRSSRLTAKAVAFRDFCKRRVPSILRD